MKHVIVLIFMASRLCAQKPAVWDSTRYQKFNTNLIVGFFQSYRHFNNIMMLPANQDQQGLSTVDYLAESNLISGIEVNYDKFGIAIGLKSTAPDSKKGDTKTINGNLNFGANRWYLENSLRYFKGFYDNNTVSHDSSFKETGEYFKQPEINNLQVKTKFFYFTRYKKYAFRSGYACNYRQLKSAGSWVFSGNLNYFDLRNDSSFFPLAKRHLYGQQGDLNGFNSFGVSLNAGAAGTLVLWKALFVNVLFIVGPEHQWRNYSFPGRKLPLFYTTIAGDVRGSIGFNFRRCYILWSSQNDFVFYNSSFLFLQNKSLAGSFSFGWRFHTATPAFYRKFQNNSLYRSI
jgi:hypothetical protein